MTGRICSPGTSGNELAANRADAHLAAALDHVGTALPYLKARAGPPPETLAPGDRANDGLWWNCDEMLANGGWFETTVASAGRRLGAPTRAVAASLFVQGYSYRVLTLAVCCLVMDGLLPGSGPAQLAMALSKGRPASVAYRRPEVLLLESSPPKGTAAREALRALVEDAVEGHIRLLVEATLRSFRVGRRLLWGNVAASAAVAFRTVEGLAGEPVKALGEQFFTLVPAELKGQGNFFSLEHAGRRGWYWERRNCCLYYLLPGNVRCSDCSLVAAAERRAGYRAALESEAIRDG